MPALYVSSVLRHRFRARAEARLDDMAGAFARQAPAGVGWRLSETLRGLAAVHGIEVHAGEWPEGAKPTLRLRRRRIERTDGAPPPGADALAERLRELQVESWEAVDGAYRFRPMGATYVASIFPPMRYSRGLDEDEARLAREVCRLSSELVGR